MTTLDWVLFALLLALLALDRSLRPAGTGNPAGARRIEPEFRDAMRGPDAEPPSNVIPFPKSRTTKNRRRR